MDKKQSPDKPVSKERGNYNEKLAVNGSFMDIVKSVVKNADDKLKKKISKDKP